MPPAGLYGFGGFTFDARSRQLAYKGQALPLTDRESSLLGLLVAQAGSVMSKDALIAALWNDIAVSDNSLEQLMSSVRRTLRDAEDGVYVETLPRRGYRFTPEVKRLAALTTADEVMALLAPHRAWIEGRAALETLDGGQVAGARAAFEQALGEFPDQAAAHLGLANACAMQFEMTRTDREPDTAALETAAAHAREACRIDPGMGESWATLGFVLSRSGHRLDALAALRRAIALEPDNWRHHLRLSSIAWGEERLREARRTLGLLPGFPLAHFLAATVLVARGALGDAVGELRRGLDPVEARSGTEPRWSGVALHWLLGLLLLAERDEDGARAAFERECELEESRHLYARECAAHAWYAIGALHLRRRELAEASEAFERALARMGTHAMARVGLAAVQGRSLVELAARAGPAALRLPAVDRALAIAAYAETLAYLGREPAGGALADAVRAVDAAVGAAEPGNAAWLLPIDPLIALSAAPERWVPVVARVRARAA